MTRTLAIVGAGSAGRALGAQLRLLGWKIGAVVTRHTTTARAAARAIGGGTPYAELTVKILDADAVLLATPDEALAAVADELAGMGGKEWKDKVVLHVSGALAATVLAPLAARNAHTGSMHPMQTFGVHARPNLDGVFFAVEGDARAVREARSMVRSLGGLPVRIEARQKATYHCAGSLAAGHVLFLLEAGTRLLEGTSISRKQAVRTLVTLSRQVLENFALLGPEAAWTGPLARGDYAVVSKHARVLRRHPEQYLEAYAAVARLGVSLLARSPRSARRQLDRALKK